MRNLTEVVRAVQEKSISSIRLLYVVRVPTESTATAEGVKMEAQEILGDDAPFIVNYRIASANPFDLNPGDGILAGKLSANSWVFLDSVIKVTDPYE